MKAFEIVGNLANNLLICALYADDTSEFFYDIISHGRRNRVIQLVLYKYIRTIEIYVNSDQTEHNFIKII